MGPGRRGSASNGSARPLLNLGNLELDAGEPERAAALLEEAERRLRPQLLARTFGWAQLALAEALAASGDAHGAAIWRGRARESFERVGDARGLEVLASQTEDARVKCPLRLR